MANLNKIILIGNLTRDPAVRVFASGGKVAQLGFAVNNRKKNQQTGQWENERCVRGIEAFHRGDFSETADLGEQYLRNGMLAFIEGDLELDQWTSQDGQRRGRVKIVVDDDRFLEPRGEGGNRPAG